MKYPKLVECLKRFSHESLRRYLGEDLVDQRLSEWENNGPLTKKRLAEMIIQLNGVDLLKKPAFRKDVLMHMDPQDINTVFSKLPATKKAGCNTVDEKASAISAIPWKPSDANLKFLELLGIDPVISTLLSRIIQQL